MKEEANETENTFRYQKIWFGILVSNFFAALVFIIMYYADKNSAVPYGISPYISSTFILLPGVMGLICAWFWRESGIGIWGRITYTILNTFIGIFVCGIFAKEG